MWNLFSKSRNFRGSKSQPFQSIIILTLNNEQELGRLLHELTRDAQFRNGKGMIHIIDHYSFDRTEETAMLYMDKYPNQIFWKRKEPLLSTSEYLKALLREPIVQVINLKEWNQTELYAPKGHITGKIGQVNRAIPSFRPNQRLNPKILVDHIERYCKNLYELIRENLLEPISVQRMKLETLKIEDMDKLIAPKQLLDRMLAYLRTITIRLDPDRFYGEKLSPCIASTISEFTERTQISCKLIERGNEPKVPYFVGISVMRIMEEILDLMSKKQKDNSIQIRIRWGANKLFIQFTSILESELTKEDIQLKVVEERASYLNGELRIKKNRDIMVIIPLHSRRDIQ